MIKSFFVIFAFLGKLFQEFRISKKRNFVRDFSVIIYTRWLSSRFLFMGDGAMIMYPVSFKGEEYISIGMRSGIGSYSIITAWDKYENETFTPQIIIGNNVWIGEFSHITAINKIYIGNNVLVGKNITITDNAHGKTDKISLLRTPVTRQLYSKGSVIINDNVWIGDKSTILAGVTIGENAIIGANSVVTKNVPSNSIVAGNPARVIKIIE